MAVIVRVLRLNVSKSRLVRRNVESVPIVASSEFHVVKPVSFDTFTVRVLRPNVATRKLDMVDAARRIDERELVI